MARQHDLMLIAVPALSAVLAVACSLLNRDGPTETCGELAGGMACQDGIIASCPDGQNLSYVVCDDREACEAAWQTTDQFRCEQGDVAPSTSSTSTSSSGTSTSTSSSGTGGTGPGVDGLATCDASCPDGYYLVANACNTECGGECTCTQRLCVSAEGYAEVELGQDGCPDGTTALVTVPSCNGNCSSCGTRSLCL